MFDVLEIQDQQKQAVVIEDTIKFCYQMIRDATWEKNISKIVFYTEMLGKYTDAKLKNQYPN
jgi:hypothetical protein